MLYSEKNSPLTFFTEVVHSRDPWSWFFDDAKRKEICGLIDRGTFRITLCGDSGERPNILPSRFVLAMKHLKARTEIHRAISVIGDHKDRERKNAVHRAKILMQSSILMLLALASILVLICIQSMLQKHINSLLKIYEENFISDQTSQIYTLINFYSWWNRSID